MINLVTTATDFTPYADKINKQFYKTQSHYVSLKERLRSVTENETYLQSVLEDSIEDFKERNPQYQKWSDIALCKADKTTLDKIAIDTTLQRLLMFFWAMSILENFWAIQAEPIRVYEDPDCPGKYVCWDGQHTAIVFFIIASLVMGEDISKCEIPIVIYPSSQKDEMRRVFMAANGEGKRPLDAIDKYQQMVFGVRTDGSTIESWLVAEQKQQWLEKAKMFATHSKFNDEGQPGAYPRMNELMDTKNFPPIITKYFTQYFTAVCRSNRPVQPKESWMLYEYLNLCENDNGIEVTNEYIRSLAKVLKTVNSGDFDAIDFVNKAKASYKHYYATNISWNGTTQGWNLHAPEKRLALTFMIAQFEKAGIAVPKDFQALWPVPAGDLF